MKTITKYGDATADGTFDGTAGKQKLAGKGGATIINNLHGEADTLIDTAGNNDVLTGGRDAFANFLFGDAANLINSRGGDDTLTGGAGAQTNYLYGDARYIIDNSVGGNDVLTGGAGAQNNYLYGDAEATQGRATCGEDRLISGTGNDHMWGDVDFSGNVVGGAVDLSLVTPGSDVFVFSVSNGQDIIYDFRQTDADKIELRQLGVTSFAELATGGHLTVSESGTDTIITFGTNTITVLDVTGLIETDFMFT